VLVIAMIEVKVHNVMHDEFDQTELEFDIEEKLANSSTRAEISDVRVSWGYKNSPIFVYINEKINMQRLKRAVKEVLRSFSHTVPNVDVRSTVTDSNLRISSSN
jgi:hypothetical protein